MPVSIEIAFDIFIFLLAIYYSRASMRTGKKFNSLVWVLALVFCLFAAWGGDYFHYQEHFVYVKTGADTHLEPPYIFIIKYLSPFYTAFRFFVWGGALMLFHFTIKRVKVPEYIVLYVFIALSLTRFSYARASLAMSIMTLGGVILADARIKKPLTFLFGALLVFVSIYFHKSALFGVAVMAAAFLIRKYMSKILMLAIIGALPVALVLLKDLLLDFMMVDSFEESLVNIGSGQRYLMGEISAVKGPATLIEEGLMRVSFYSAAILFVLSVFKNKYKEFPDIIKYVACSSFLAVAGASLFAFNTGFETSTLFNRFLLFSSLPSSIFVAYLIKEKHFLFLTRFTVVIAVFASLFALLYSLYCSIVA